MILKEHTQDVEFNKLKIIANELERYKKEYNLVDFNDMILNFTKSDACPKFDVVLLMKLKIYLQCNGIWLKLYGINQQIIILQAMMTRLFLNGPVLM
jgi:hypothetical protein